jgi:hypothetical protein
MNAKNISDRIKNLSSETADEALFRHNAQIILLLIEACALNPYEKEGLLTILRKQVRNRVSRDFSGGNNQVFINSLLEELCLAADFYLLETGKRICLFPEESNSAVSIDLRAFENCFYGIIRELLKKSDTVCVYVRSSGLFCTLIFRTEDKTHCLEKSFPDALYLYENNSESLCLKIGKCESADIFPVREDFSLLLCDRMSALHLWLCDI